MKKTLKVKNLLPVNEEHVLHFAMRYALNRNTAAPSIVVREIEAKWPRIRDWTQKQMKEEVTRAIRDFYFAETLDTGKKMAIETWQRVLVLPI